MQLHKLQLLLQHLHLHLLKLLFHLLRFKNRILEYNGTQEI